MSEEEILSSKFGAQTIFALRHTGEICGSNGLPLTPKSIGILGTSQILKTLKHPHLASYLDFIRGKHERLMIVSEFDKTSLKLRYNKNGSATKIAHQVLQALNYLNQNGIVHRMLSPDNILMSENGDVKLFNYGLYHMTNNGIDVEFPIGSIKYTAPEVLLSTFNSNYYSGSKVDVWSLGIILTEIIFGKELWPSLKLSQCLRKVLSLIYCDDVLSRIARESDSVIIYQDMEPALKNFLELCLQIDPRQRGIPQDLLKHKVFAGMSSSFDSEFEDLDLIENKGHPLNSWHFHELYYLWQLAGGDVHTDLKRNGLIKTKPPILSMPSLILLEGMSFGHVKDPSRRMDLKVVPLSLETLTVRLKHLPFNAYYPLIETKSHLIEDFEDGDKGSDNLPLIIRERDTEYQFKRIVLFRRLLQGYPYTRALLCHEASKDIPPYYRGKVWAALLNVKGDIERQYISIDKETPIPTDRQIEVDIPRCHQYNELLSSKAGHLKLKRILKAWVVSSKQYVYWQGLDSLCAPFLFLNFNNEARAFACFSAFIPKYLHNFFLKDNSAVIKEYLAKFAHLIAYHDPVLANHLLEINFVPELFAIPWFLTMFSHVFPLHKIFHLWDKLLLGDSSYPLFIGLAVLQQLRDTLLSSGFNECILLFSDLPEVDIEGCVVISSQLYADTPQSITFRKFQLKSTDEPAYVLTDTTLMEIQKETNPRLSVSDFLQLFKTKETRSNILIVDARSDAEYANMSVPGSINIPFDSINFEKDVFNGIPSSPELSVLINNKGKIIIVIAQTAPEASKVCSFLTLSDFPKICFLHGGIESLHSSGVLAPVLI
ncbi:hypothetical protein V9T40_008620 [Parthenolecanium corni]|uniref:TBC domain-containing protein kinase-like protein n=1 Tax=Parthenolecanium corni TaxID=536013 RepID=A0AAN9TL78_9HEMI